MRVTIIKDDNAVIVDGERHTVDCTGLPVDFHALQWNVMNPDCGEVEYNMTRCDHCGVRSKKGNAIISDVSPYQPYVDAWQDAKNEAAQTRVEAERAAAALAAQEAGANAAG